MPQYTGMHVPLQNLSLPGLTSIKFDLTMNLSGQPVQLVFSDR